MTKYFDKTFFKFLLGFIAILAISFSITFAAVYWEKSSTTQDMRDGDVETIATEFAATDECLTDSAC